MMDFDGHHGPPPDADARSGRLSQVPYRWVAMGVVVFGTFMVVLDTTIVNLGLQSLREDFGTVEGVEWVVTAYLAAVGITQTCTGWLADRYGRRACFVLAMTIFTTSSLLCAVSVDLWMLIAMRLLQGIGGGLLMPVAMAMVYELFDPEERGRALGYFGIAVMAAPAIGPVLGGGLVSSLGWRWLFLINVPIGAVGIPLALKLLNDTGYRERRAFDARGLIVGGSGLALLLVGMERGADGWANPSVVVMLASSVVLLALFVRHLTRTTSPLIDTHIFTNPVFVISMCAVALMTIAQYSRLVYIPLELASVRRISELQIGVAMLPSALGVAATMPIGGRLADRVGARVPASIGITILGTSFIGLAMLTLTTPLWVISIILFIGGLGSGLCMMAPNIVAMNSVEARHVSQASGLSNVARQTAAAIGTAVMASIFAITRPPDTEVATPEALEPYRVVFLVGAVVLAVGLVVAQFLPGREKALELQRQRREEFSHRDEHASVVHPH